jgi:hypothetical protein
LIGESRRRRRRRRRKPAMGGEAKPGRAGLKSWAQRHLNAGFVVGFFLVLLTYLVISRQFAITAPNGNGSNLLPSPFLHLLSRSFVRFPLHRIIHTVSYMQF